MGFGLFRGDDDGGGYLVLRLEVEEFDPLRPPAGGPDGFGVDADDLAELADDHQLAGLVDQVDAGDLAVFGRGLDVDDALAAAALQPVFVDIGALAKAVLRDRKDQAWGEAELLFELLQLR